MGGWRFAQLRITDKILLLQELSGLAQVMLVTWQHHTVAI